MSKGQDNKAIVGRWFTEFWGNAWNPAIVTQEIGLDDGVTALTQLGLIRAA
jgi:hypothetical protein